MKKNIKRISRYTSLPVLLDLLKRKCLVLLDPQTWEDKNDSEILQFYARQKKFQKLFALCFTSGDETIHDWKTYANGISGCCIEFEAKGLLALLDRHPEVRYDTVEYKKLYELKDSVIELDAIPFTKRWPYRCEEEFRIIHAGSRFEQSYEIPFDLQIISRIVISQQMPEPVYHTIRDYLREAFDHPEQRINRSTLYENKIWINKFKRA